MDFLKLGRIFSKLLSQLYGGFGDNGFIFDVANQLGHELDGYFAEFEKLDEGFGGRRPYFLTMARMLYFPASARIL